MSRSKLFSAVLSMLVLSVSGCELVSPASSPSMRRLVRILSDSADYSLYSYSGGKLSEMDIVRNLAVAYSIRYSYDGGNRPSSGLISEYGSDTTETLEKFHYDATLRLDSMDVLLKDRTGNFSMNEHLYYSYDAQGRVIRWIAYDPQYRTIYFTVELSYDSEGDVVRRVYYTPEGYTETSTMSYDDELNPLYDMRQWLMENPAVSRHNEISSITVYSGGIRPTSEVNYAYTYDSNGYPVSSSVTGTQWNQTIKYGTTYEYQ